MLHLSIVTETNIVSLNGICLVIEDMPNVPGLIAVHWLEGKGWEEHRVGDKVVIKDISDINHYRYIIDLYNEVYASLSDSDLPRSNIDLIDFIEDTLMTVELMRESPEWEDFKIATNRA